MPIALARLATAAVIAASLALTPAAHADSDWRKSAPQEEKIQKLVEVMPSTANLMLEVGARYRHLYWAAKLGRWEFAAYQAEEIEALIETLQITRPGRAQTAAVFLEMAYPEITDAAESGEWQRFEKAFQRLRQECLACHAANEHAFITLPEVPPRSTSPVLHGLEPSE